MSQITIFHYSKACCERWTFSLYKAKKVKGLLFRVGHKLCIHFSNVKGQVLYF